MKKLIYFGFFIILLSLYYIACNEDKNPPRINAVPFKGPAKIVAIFNKCLDCHSPEKIGADKWTYDPTNYESIKSNIGIIIKETNTYGQNMAGITFANLSREEVRLLQIWYQAGANNKED